MRVYPFLREIRSPVMANQLRPLSPKCRTVQFSKPLTERDHSKLGHFMRRYPHVQLRVYGHYFEPCDLGFLSHYPTHRHFAIDVFGLNDLDGLKLVSPDLQSLGLGPTKSKAHSLSFLLRFPRLQSLHLGGHTKDIAVIGALSCLQHLTIASITLPDLSILRPLSNLRSLAITLGGTKDLQLLPKIGALRYLQLLMVRGLADLEPIASVRTLQYLFLRALRNVTVLPSLGRLHKLRRVHLETMKGLVDLQPVAKAPGLEELVVLDMRQLEPEAFRPFVGHPALRRATVGLGSTRKNKAVNDLLRLPSVDEEFVFRGS